MMQRFKFDMHIHTSETSGCGQVPAKEVVRLYHQAGYQGIMITDHFHKEYFDSLGNLNDREKIEQYLSGYHTAKAEGEQIGLKVVLGIEFRNTETDDDFLIVGITEEFLYRNPRCYELPLEEAIQLFHDNGMLVIQAHPVRFAVMDWKDGKICRYGTWKEMQEMKQKNPEWPVIYQEQWKQIQDEHQEKELPTPFILQVCTLRCENLLDGVESCNGNVGWAQDPDEVAEILEKHPEYLQISASDFHEKSHLAQGGLIFDREISDSRQLKEALLSGGIKSRIIHRE